ncbi:UNVERIFIED_CONTAM: putative NAD(P)H dehydrogenase (quinone) FQR1-like 2 [Sesamum calycinum]|uniref:NAD(P)H dehydrogenase (quinone) n=1 Tax=Sesamum calycinum TaxID=2727403 RepID=A0AAW2KML3_9LAMI
MYGHVEGLARRMKRGADSVDGVEAELYRVPETLPEEVLIKMRAPPKDDSIPVIGSPEDLASGDGFLFGFPTRYGCMAAQMKAFFDSTGQLWREQKLAGKPAGSLSAPGLKAAAKRPLRKLLILLVSSIVWTAITQLAHHGMLFVPIGYTFGAGMFKMDSIRGGSPYGAGVFAGDGTREPSELELALAEHQGKYMAAIVKRLAHR